MSHTVIVTGATKGLGRATALAFAQAGHRVIGLYFVDEAAAEKLRSELQSFGGGSFVVRHNVSTENAALWSCPEIQQAESLVLINNACAPFTRSRFTCCGGKILKAADLKASRSCSGELRRPIARAGCGTIVNAPPKALT